MPTTWGYYGADTLVRQLAHASDDRAQSAGVHRRLVSRTDALMGAAETGIVEGDPTAVPGALRALGVSHVIVRKDIDFNSKIRVPDVPSRDELARRGRGRGGHPSGGEHVRSPTSSSTRAAPSRSRRSAARSRHRSPRGSASRPRRERARRTRDHDVGGTVASRRHVVRRRQPRGHGDTAFGRNVAVRTAGNGTPIAEISAAPEALVLRDAVRLSIDGTPIAARPDVTVPTVTAPGAVAVNGELARPRTRVRNSSGSRRAPCCSPTDQQRRTTSRGWSAPGDCARYDEQPEDALRLGAEYVRHLRR